jgi:uncharacterized protein (TIGR02145 family)
MHQRLVYEKMRNCLLILIFSLFDLALDAQAVSNVKAKQEGQKIKVSYDLECKSPVEIKLSLSEDNGKTWQKLSQGVSGDIGNDVTQGSHVIYWDVLQSKEKLVGSSFVFKVIASEEFKTVQIGNQVWMAENLNVDHYRNGDLIPNVKDEGQWSELNSGAWCYYNNELANGEIYGKLYNWYAVNDKREICPVGWHVPSYKEWSSLKLNFISSENVGGELKSKNFWMAPNTGAVNSVGFNAFPGGYREENGKCIDLKKFGDWWCQSEYDNELAWYEKLSFNNASLKRHATAKQFGLSVRCVKD